MVINRSTSDTFHLCWVQGWLVSGSHTHVDMRVNTNISLAYTGTAAHQPHGRNINFLGAEQTDMFADWWRAILEFIWLIAWRFCSSTLDLVGSKISSPEANWLRAGMTGTKVGTHKHCVVQFITTVKEVFQQDYRKNFRPVYHETWWKGVGWAKEEPIRSKSKSRVRYTNYWPWGLHSPSEF